ncbi:hypothetical protein DFJ43DRAFT_1162301 [Lentinula guzmanii]|uniref:Uncharacterized protein n=1 Tax=Lentinula guzmanii TaxID=2804957 RepID=A0AA38J5U8_9AGAR|nr:hypothetical protein DFJ43DRAFT_1162301 [Lentinula guzmanii]
MDNSTTPRICSTKKCNAVLPPEHIDKAKTCFACRQKDRDRKKRKRAVTQPVSNPIQPPSANGNPINNDDSDDEDDKISVIRYSNGEDMFQALKKASHKNLISFHGEYTMPTDPFLSDRERVKLVANEIWKVTGYRFT